MGCSVTYGASNLYTTDRIKFMFQLLQHNPFIETDQEDLRRFASILGIEKAVSTPFVVRS